MISTNATRINALAKNAVSRAYAELHVYNQSGTEFQWSPLTPAELSSVTIEESACVNGTFTVGSTVASAMKFSVLTSIIGSAVLDGCKVIPFMGYYDGNTKYTVQKGVFFIDGNDISTNGLFTNLSSYDIMLSANLAQPIDTRSISSESTVGDVLDLIETATGITFDTSQIDTTVTYKLKLIEGDSARTLIGKVAVSTMSNCFATYDGTVRFVKPSSTSVLTINASDYFTGGYETYKGTQVTYLQAEVIEGDSTVTSTYPVDWSSGGTGLGFDDSYFPDTDSFQTVASRLGVPITYKPFKLNCVGFPNLEPMDCVSIVSYKDSTTTKYNAPKLVHTYNGGLTTELSAEEIDSGEAASVSRDTSTALSQLRNDALPAIVYVDVLRASSVTADDLVADHATISNLDVDYLKVDVANATDATIENLYATSGFIQNIQGTTGSFTGDLNAVRVNGDLINAKTITAEKVILRDPLGNTGVLYELNANAVRQQELTPEELDRLTLNGDVITIGSLSADRVNVTDLNAFNATIGGFEIGSDSLHSNGASFGSGAGFYVDNAGNLYVGDSSADVYLKLGVSNSEFDMRANNINVNGALNFGDFKWINRSNGNLTLKWVREV